MSNKLTSTRKLSLLTYKLTVFVLFIISMYPWFIWNVSAIYICALASLVSVFFYLLNKRCFSLKKKNIPINALLILAFLLYGKSFSLFGTIEQIFVFINIIFMLNLKDGVKTKIFDFITKGMAVLLSISLFFYIIHLLGVPLPSSNISSSKLGYTSTNYYFFLTDLNFVDFNRFKSIFAEPGHLTMGLIPLLYVNRFNLKNKAVLVLLIAQLFTLSLAGFIAIVFVLVVYSFSRSGSTFYPRITLAAIIILSVFFVSRLSDDNLLYLAIVSRLTFNETTGTIAGYDRTDAITDEYFVRFIKSSNLFLGLGSEKTDAIVSEGSAGYKIFLIRFGLIAALIIFAFYLSFPINYPKYEIFCFFLLLMLLLSQDAYPFWFSVVFSFILGVPKLYNQPKLLPKISKK